MPPSSLVFAVILAVWAAYLVQHWVRRRDHIATARSVDRFSEAMRVLERRQRRPRLDLCEPTTRSYAVSLNRPASPEVVVKHADSSAVSPKAAARTPAPAPALVRKPAVARGPAAAASTRWHAAVLLTAAAVMVVATALGMVGVLPPWTAAIGVGVFVASLLAIRFTVRRSGTAVRPVTSRPLRAPTTSRSRTSRPTSSRPMAGTTSARGHAPAKRRSAASAAGGAAAALAATVHAEPMPAPRETSPPTRDRRLASPPARNHEPVAPQARPAASVFDFDAFERDARSASPTAVNAPATIDTKLEEGTWQPVPVPPPTYTLKAKAQPRLWPTELPADATELLMEEDLEELPVAIRGLA